MPWIFSKRSTKPHYRIFKAPAEICWYNSLTLARRSRRWVDISDLQIGVRGRLRVGV